MTDITAWLAARCSELPADAIVKLDSLTLLDAMNALEINAPKMDTGHEAKLKGRFDPHAELSAEQTCWIMDEMMANEIAWYGGHTLAQTVFSSLHYHNAHALTGNAPLVLALRAYVLAYAKTVDLVYAECGRGMVKDCEDVWLDHAGIAVAAAEDDEDVVAWCEHAMSGVREGEWEDEVIKRLELRVELLRLLVRDQAPASVPPMRISAAAVDWAFDNVTPCLRQHMPLPEVTVPTHAEAWKEMARVFEQLHWLAQGAEDWSDFTLSFKVIGAGSAFPFVRSLHKTYRLDYVTDTLLAHWLASTGAPADTFPRLQAELVDATERRAFAMLRDITGGNLIAHLAAHLANLPRRRRDLVHVSRVWADQLAAARRLAHHAPARALVAPLEAAMLDAQFEAARLGLAVGLATDTEAFFTWTHVFAVVRRQVALRPTGWEREWAQAWMAIAAAGMIRHAGHADMGANQYHLRHKLTPADCAVDHAEAVRTARAIRADKGRDSTADQWLAQARASIDALARDPRCSPLVDEITPQYMAIQGVGR
ncbi:N-alpha-acetyltransferase, non-catalitic subunit [Cryptotrichosporon argae]